MRTVPALAFSLLLLASSPGRAQTWYESFHQAQEAIAAEDWGAALQHLNAAVEKQPRSSARTRTYGMRFIRYYPYLELGIAYYELGRYDAALQAFETEERQNEIEKSADDLARFRSYRDRVQQQLAQQVEVREQRTVAVVTDNLATASRLEEEGNLEDALSALSRVLAVAPEHPQATAARGRLLDALAVGQEQQEEAARWQQLVDDARTALSSGRHREAAASFSEALDLRDDPQVRAMLAESQQRLRAEIRVPQSRQESRRLIERGLARVAELERAGELERALEELQTVLALDASNREARSLQQRILRAQAEQAASERQDHSIAEQLAEAQRLLDAGDFARALTVANRILVLDPENETALQQIGQGYSGLSAALLASDSAPPAVVMDDLSESAQGVARQVIRAPEVVLTGRVYDATPVELEIVGDAGPIGDVVVDVRQLQGIWITDFRWQHRLARGAASFELVATDPEGNQTRAPFELEYVVPFFRSPWLPLSVLAAVALLVTVALLQRARRRQKLLRSRFNPYIAGAPILEQARFFGRRQLQDYVLRRICNNSIMLYGERRIGKTSFQHQLKRHLAALDDPDHEFYPVFIDLQGTPQERFFGTLAAEIFHELAPKLDGMQPRVRPGQEEYGYRQLVRDIQGVLRVLGEGTRKKVKLVLLIDEVDELNTYDPRVNQRLRSLFMRTFADNLVCVVSGVAIKKHWEREGSPWYNFFQEIEVEPLDQREAKSLIEAPVRGVFELEDGVAEEIIKRTGSKPYLIQRLCSALVDRMHEERRRRMTLGDVDAGCQIEGL